MNLYAVGSFDLSEKLQKPRWDTQSSAQDVSVFSAFVARFRNSVWMSQPASTHTHTHTRTHTFIHSDFPEFAGRGEARFSGRHGVAWTMTRAEFIGRHAKQLTC